MSVSSFTPRRACTLILAGVFLGLGTARVVAAPAPTGPRSGEWAHEHSKIAPDPQVTWGRLDNGFRYALLPHHGVPGRVALQLVVLTGSLDERPDELGIAHFTEHMAFGGSKNFRPEDMIALFQRLGVEYGSDVNAQTGFDATTFRLDFRENDAALLREGLKLFRDFGDGLTFPPEIIERERRVVRAELRNRNTLAAQRDQASLPVVFRGLRFPERSPGGSEALIAKFTREQFQRFYQRCYRPDLMVLVAAGDFEAGAMATLVRGAFGSMVRPREPIPPRDEGRLDARSPRAGVFRIAGLRSVAAEVASLAPLPPRADARTLEVERQRRTLVMELFSDRLRTELTTGGAPEASYEDMLGNGVATVSAIVPAEQWSDGITELDTLVRLTLERGFDAADLEPMRQRQLRLAQLMLEQLPTVDPGNLCDALTESITAHVEFVGFERKFRWMQEWLQAFTAADAREVFRGLWKPETMAFHLAGGVDFELTAEKVLSAVQKNRRNGLANLTPRLHGETRFILPRWGSPTTVVESHAVPELGAKLLKFGNNVRLNFVSNRQEPGLVRVAVRVGAGLLDMPGNKPALKEFGLNTVLASGAVHFRSEQLNRLIEDRLLEFSFDVADRDAFTFRGLMATDQLPTFLGIVTDFLHEPQFNSFVHADERERAALGRMSGSVGMQDGLRELTDYLFKGDPRFTWGQPLDYIAMSVVDVRRWMEEPLAHGYVETTIVGDIAEDAAVATVSRTLGSLAPRAATKRADEPPRPVTVTAPAGYNRIEFVGEQNVGLVVGTWPVESALHVRDHTALELLAKILELRVRTEVRENLGLAYSPTANFNEYDGFPGFALLQAQIDCGPNDTERVAPVVQAVAAKLAAGGISEGEFVGARGILKSQLRQSFRENGFLLNTLLRAQERPDETQEIVALHGGLLDRVTRDEVNTWAAKVLPASNCRAAAIVPKAFVGVFEAVK